MSGPPALLSPEGCLVFLSCACVSPLVLLGRVCISATGCIQLFKAIMHFFSLTPFLALHHTVMVGGQWWPDG